MTTTAMNRADGTLVFDIGLNNGDDAAYYLSLGHDVVGIEANPLLADQCTQRFESEIRKGRMNSVSNAGGTERAWESYTLLSKSY